MDPNWRTNLKLVQVVVQEEGGSGFISRPNGDLGGDGRIWAPKDWTVVKEIRW